MIEARPSFRILDNVVFVRSFGIVYNIRVWNTNIINLPKNLPKMSKII